MFRGLGVVGVIGLVCLAACSSAESDASSTTASSVSVSESVASTTTEPDKAPPDDAVALNLPVTLGVDEIEGRVMTPGDRPVLAWDAVPGASSYQLVVRDAEGMTTWAWSGSTTSIAVGGGADPAPADTPGALLAGPSTWVVVAFDDAGNALAASLDLEVAP